VVRKETTRLKRLNLPLQRDQVSSKSFLSFVLSVVKNYEGTDRTVMKAKQSDLNKSVIE
jgi:hypothetical protein